MCGTATDVACYTPLMKQAELEAARKRLLVLRDELEALSDAAEEARSTVHLDQQSVGRLSRMDALQSQAMAQATERTRLAAIKRIDAALQRIDDGDYGICTECGEEIAVRRLEIDPAVPQCVGCAGRAR